MAGRWLAGLAMGAAFSASDASALILDTKAPQALVQDIYRQTIEDQHKPVYGDEASFYNALGMAGFSTHLEALWSSFGELDPEARTAGIAYNIVFHTQADLDADAVSKSLKLATVTKGDIAFVTATFQVAAGPHNPDSPSNRTIVYVLVKEGDAWKIDDIDYGEESLRDGVYEGFETQGR